ncbi:hypothetical protein K1X84_14480 [bacterium]|nr:hypothetical protein [bacterium]
MRLRLALTVILTSFWINGCDSSGSNQAPSEPSSPLPAYGLTDVAIDAVLAWDADDPDGDDLTFDVRFYLDEALTNQIDSSIGITVPYYQATLEYNTIYFWQVTAYDGHTSTKGPVWLFTTEDVPATVLMDEDFETSLIPNEEWLTGDNNPNSGLDFWDDQPTNLGGRAYKSDWALHCAFDSDVPGQKYDNDMLAYFERANSAGVSLNGYTEVQLSFWVWYDTELDSDYVQLQYWTGSDWADVTNGYFTGTSSGWQKSIISFTGIGTLWVRWLFVSNAQNTKEGAYLDDILLTGKSLSAERTGKNRIVINNRGMQGPSGKQMPVKSETFTKKR